MNKKNILCGLLLLPLFSQSQILNKHIAVAEPSVSILHMEPAQPVEGKPLLVFFRFTNSNKSGTTLNGWIGGDINSGTGFPGSSSGDWEIINLAPNASIDGAVWMKAPDAGINRVVRVYFYQEQHMNGNQVIKSPPLYSIGEQTIHIAAELQFSLESFKINHTRARSTDTDYGSLYVERDNQPVMRPAAIYLGNFEDGTFPFQAANANSDPNGLSSIKKLITDPFTIIPQQNSTISISYFMINAGAIEDQNSFLERMATATADPEVFKVHIGSSAGVSFAKALNPFFYIIGACDGLVVAERKEIQTNQFYYNQYGNADFNERYNSEVFSSQAGCGNTSDYEVNSKIRKTSNPVDGRYNYSPGLKVHQQSKLNVQNHPGAFFIWERMETIAADGSFISTSDPAYGFMEGHIYHAPAEVTSSRLVIMRGHRPRFMFGIQPLTSETDMSTEEVTLVIQLLPGPLMMKVKPIDKTEAAPLQMRPRPRQ